MCISGQSAVLNQLIQAPPMQLFNTAYSSVVTHDSYQALNPATLIYMFNIVGWLRTML